MYLVVSSKLHIPEHVSQSLLSRVDTVLREHRPTRIVSKLCDRLYVSNEVD